MRNPWSEPPLRVLTRKGEESPRLSPSAILLRFRQGGAISEQPRQRVAICLLSFFICVGGRTFLFAPEPASCAARVCNCSLRLTSSFCLEYPKNERGFPQKPRFARVWDSLVQSEVLGIRCSHHGAVGRLVSQVVTTSAVSSSCNILCLSHCPPTSLPYVAILMTPGKPTIVLSTALRDSCPRAGL